jgi:hypothetical protein
MSTATVLARLARLERAAGTDDDDWRVYLPVGISVEAAREFTELWARLAAGYPDDHGGSLSEAFDATLEQAITLFDEGHPEGVADDEDDEDDEDE